MPVPSETLLQAHPWWMTNQRLEDDVHLRAYRRSPFKWSPPVLHELPLEVGHLHTLRGPRQVGKTTTVKLLMERLLERGEKRVLYHSLDLESDKRSIPELLQLAKRTHPKGSDGPWYIFLDEVTSVRDWQSGVKYAWDQGLIREDFVLCTGSSAPAVVAERLPGRRGAGRDWIQLPMSFREFCRSVRKIALPEETLPPGGYVTADGVRLAAALHAKAPELDSAFVQYSATGGFPRAVLDALTLGAVSPSTLETFWAVLAGDVDSLGRNKVAALKFLERACVSLGSPLAWDALREAMDAGSHATAQQYAQVLAESFQILVAFHFSSHGGIEPRKQRKIYLMDPLISQIPAAILPGARHAPPDGLIENLIAVGLFRSSVSQLLPSTPLPGSLAYWRSAAGREIDFVVWESPDGSARLPVEVKGDSASGLKGAVASIRQAFGRGIVVSRTVFAPDPPIPIIPAPVFLAGLRERVERLEV